MPPAAETRLLPTPRGPAAEARSFLAQMDDQSRRLLEDLRGATAAELAWQPRPGTNTIGMLLAHIAIVEVFWLMIAQERYSEAAFPKLLGIGESDDGIPLGAPGRPPAVLRGRTLAFYVRLLARARAYTRRAAGRWSARDLDRVVIRTRANGRKVRHNLRWILYHVLEHEAGHYGQVLLLRHLYRDRRKPS